MTDFRKILLASFLLFFLATPALALDLEGSFKQGGMVIGQTEPGGKIFLGDKEVLVGPEGRFVMGFGRDENENVLLKIISPTGAIEELTLTIEPQIYEIDRVDGLPERTVTIPEEEKIRRQKEQGMVREARASVTHYQDWAAGFLRPAEGRISGVYGSQRILNGQPRWPHYGLDIAGEVGGPVKAPAGGIVRLAENNFLLEGGIIIIDHGFGVNSTFLHLSEVNVSVGQRVEQGDLVGAIGMTGRATGPHLDWRVNWGSVRLDPALVLEAFSKDER
jgi:murein DD-endopeptidase MepM/ murein hydrolase activator NlpD